MSPRATQITMAIVALIGPSGAAGWLNEPVLAFGLLLIAALPLLAFEASYRRWRPWAIEAIGIEDPSPTTITTKAIAAELAVWIAIAIGGTGWTLIGVRLVWMLVDFF